MHAAFGIVRLFPEGGLQRDCIRLARLLIGRGHQVMIFTSQNLCDLQDLSVVLLPVRAYTNHGTDWAFARKFAAAVAGRFDRVVGFNKLIDLDILYCADPPVEDRRRGWWYRALPRHRARLRLEGETFRPLSSTHIIALRRSLAERYQHHWGLGMDRFTILPPAVDPARRRPDVRISHQHNALRAALRLPADRPIWIWIGAKPRIKGLDRVLETMVMKTDAVLLVVEKDAAEGGFGAML